jgi:hypothetical protein
MFSEQIISAEIRLIWSVASRLNLNLQKWTNNPYFIPQNIYKFLYKQKGESKRKIWKCEKNLLHVASLFRFFQAVVYLPTAQALRKIGIHFSPVPRALAAALSPGRASFFLTQPSIAARPLLPSHGHARPSP